MDVVEVERRRNGGCRASVAKGARVFLDLVAFVYALYGSALFFIVILMWVFSILITIYVSISSGELWVQLFAVGLGIPFIGPFVNVLEEAFIVILRTLRVGFQSQLRPHVFEFLLLPYTFPDKAVFGRYPENNKRGNSSQQQGQEQKQGQDLAEPLNDAVNSSPENSYTNRQISNNRRGRTSYGHARLERLYDAVHVAFEYLPPDSFSMQQKLALLFLAADFLCFIIFMLLEVSSGFAARAFVCLVVMLLCSVLRFLRSSPTSVAELHRRLSNGRSARWVKYTTGGAGIFIFSSTASSGLWAKRSDVYTFAIIFFAVVIGALSTLSLIAVCLCPYPLPLQKHFPGLAASAEEAGKENERRLRLEAAENESASSSAVGSYPSATPTTTTSTLIPTVAATVKSLFLTVVLFLLIVIFFIAIFVSRGTGAGSVDEGEVSTSHRWWSLFVWLLLGAIAGAHSISDDELIGADDEDEEEGSDKNNGNNSNADYLLEGNSPKPSAPKKKDEERKKNSENNAAQKTSSSRRSESELGTVAPTSESDEDGQQQHYAPPVVPSRENESESQNSTSNRAQSVAVAIAGKEEKTATPTASVDKKKAKKQKAFVRNTQVASRAIVGLTTFLFFVVVGCMTALNFPNTVPATFRAYDLSILRERKHPYTLCSAKWGTDDRFNVTDLVLIAKAAYYEDAGQVEQALRLWFNTPLNVTETTVVKDPHDHSSTVGEYGHSQSLGVRAYRIVFHETIRSVASALPAAVEPQSWMYAANVTLPRMDIVAVRGSHNGLDWLQDAYVWGDSIFFSLFNRVSPFSLPQSVVNSLVKWSKSLRYGVFGDISYFKQLKAITEAVMDDARAENSSRVMIVGHSLGGGLAQLVGSALKIDAFAVSGVGIGFQAAAAEFDVDTARWYQSNIVPAYDPVPQIDLQIGEVQNIACSAAPNPLGCHSLSTTWGELARSCGDIRETNDLEGKSTPLVGELLSQITIAIVFLFAWIKLINVRVVISAVMFLERRACRALSEADLKD